MAGYPILGLRSFIIASPDVAAARAWYIAALGIEPYFDEPGYVGFDLGGYELGIFGRGDPGQGAKTYWGVANVDEALSHFVAAGATEDEPVSDVGGGIRMAAVRDPQGILFGLIENPAFAARQLPNDGPGR